MAWLRHSAFSSFAGGSAIGLSVTDACLGRWRDYPALVSPRMARKNWQAGIFTGSLLVAVQRCYA